MNWNKNNRRSRDDFDFYNKNIYTAYYTQVPILCGPTLEIRSVFTRNPRRLLKVTDFITLKKRCCYFS